MTISKTAPIEVIAADREIEALLFQAKAELKGVETLMIGRVVHRHDVAYKVSRAQIGLGGHIELHGVCVNGGKVGTRVFRIGHAILCKFEPLADIKGTSERNMTRDQEISNLVVSVCREFQTFGRGSASVAGNPIFDVLKDKPPMFALGVDVEKVVRFVLQKGRHTR